MYYNNYDYDSINHAIEVGQVMAVWTIVALILAIVGGILVYFLFIKGNHKLGNGLAKFRDLLDFKIMLIEPILKILYLMLTIFIVLFSFNFIAVNFLAFLLFLLLGPVIVRLIYEGSLMLIMIWKNTKIISENTEKSKEKKSTNEKAKEE